MNFNKYSVILATLKIKGKLNRVNIWKYVQPTNLFSGCTNFKSNLNHLTEIERVGRKPNIERNLLGNAYTTDFFYNFNSQHPRNEEFDQDMYTKMETLIKSIDSRAERREQLSKERREAKLKERQMSKKSEQLELKRQEEEKKRVDEALKRSKKLYE
eukprot:gene6085-7583_t